VAWTPKNQSRRKRTSGHASTGNANDRYGSTAAHLIQWSDRPIVILQDLAGAVREATRAEEAARSHPGHWPVAEPSAVLEEAETGEPLQRLAVAPPTEARRGAPSVSDVLRGAWHAIEGAYRGLGDAGGEAVESPAAEWLLDNYYIVERAARVVRDEFPPAFERRLRRVVSGEPLVLALARGFVAVGSGHLEGDGIRRLTAEFQAGRRLSIAQLWALPIMLRVALLERLGVAVAANAAACRNYALPPLQALDGRRRTLLSGAGEALPCRPRPSR
jgi:hypothetical protein